MKGFTERQLKRRERILTAARKLITDRGYDGVTMRDLATESGVAPKTLYHQFHSKENLLRVAVEERYRYLYQIIDDEQIEHGIDRLFFIIDTVARSLLGDENSSSDMSAFVTACNAVQRHIDGAVIGVHHAGKDATRGMRGSTALLGAVDAALRVTQEDDRGKQGGPRYGVKACKQER